MDRSQYLRRLWMAAGVLAALLFVLALFWRLAEVLLLVFGGVLFAVLLDGMARFVMRWTRLPRSLAVAAALLLLVGAGIGAGWLAGPAIAGQLGELGQRLPSAVDDLAARLHLQRWSADLLGGLAGSGGAVLARIDVLGRLSGAFSTLLGDLANVVMVLLIGVYLAVAPRTYRAGLLHLVPATSRERASEVVHALRRALGWWLLGRLTAMALVGLVTAIGLRLVGSPLAGVLGMIAGLLSFVPYFGPVAAAVPALLIALGGGGVHLVWVTGVYVGVQLLEGNVVTPLVQQEAVALPPAILLAAQLVLGVLYGLLGLLFATPLAVVLMVLVQTLYVQDVLGEPIPVLGERDVRSDAGTRRAQRGPRSEVARSEAGEEAPPAGAPSSRRSA